MIDFADIPFAKDVSPCSYYPEKTCTQFFNMTSWYKLNKGDVENPLPPIQQYYSYLKKIGFCRYNSVFYKYRCENCKQCVPIRIPVKEFKPSKNQKTAWKKNQDIRVVLKKDSTDFVSPQKALLFREYDAYHNGTQPDFEKMSIEKATERLTELNSGYDGTWNLEYWLNDILIGVSILDVTENREGKIDSICSNYFYYDITPQIMHRSLGIFSVLKEIELCKETGAEFYYLGLHLAGCRKMNYKTMFEPHQLLINGLWLPSSLEFPEYGELSPDYPEVCHISNDIELPVLLAAYKNGAFPWFVEEENNPVVYQYAEPRFVINLDELHVPKTLAKFLKHTKYTYTMDKCFERVIEECAAMKRKNQDKSWIGPKMKKAYLELHQLGYAHSIEVWNEGKLAGGFYGVLIGAVFCGESMFTVEDNSSSSAFVLFARAFKQCGGKMIDCQVYTDNMARYGAKNISRIEYKQNIEKYQRIRLLDSLEDCFNKICTLQLKKE